MPQSRLPFTRHAPTITPPEPLARVFWRTMMHSVALMVYPNFQSLSLSLGSVFELSLIHI